MNMQFSGQKATDVYKVSITGGIMGTVKWYSASHAAL